MYAGVDVGTSTVKVVTGEKSPSEFRQYALRSGEPGKARRAMLRRIAEELKTAGVKRICATGTGASDFVGVTREVGGMFIMYNPDKGTVLHELKTQAEGVRRLLKTELGGDPDEFMVVSIGTGTSFTLVTRDGVRQYEPGLSLGGRTIQALASYAGVTVQDIDAMARQGEDVDLLMKHVVPTLNPLKSSIVLASMGRLIDDDVPEVPQNFCAGVVKMVATATIGHLMSIRQHPDWRWDGPTVFIGTPVEKLSVLNEWLTVFSGATGMKGRFLSSGTYAGAVGAMTDVCDTYGIHGEPRAPDGMFSRWRKTLRRIGRFLVAFRRRSSN